MTETLPPATWQVLEPITQGHLRHHREVGVARLPHDVLRLFFWLTPEAMGLLAPCCKRFDPVNGTEGELVCWSCGEELAFSRAFFLSCDSLTQDGVESRLAAYLNLDPFQASFTASGLLLDYEQWRSRHPISEDLLGHA